MSATTTTTTTTAEHGDRSPQGTRNRIALLDVLRGFAILGTLGTNIWIFSAGSLSAILERATEGTRWWESGDELIYAVSTFLTNGKFLALLSVLFGVGLEIQYQSARRRGLPWLRRYVWRSLLLLLDGFIHFALVVEFDILMGYAVAAMLVAFVVGRSERMIRAVMWAAGAIHLALFTAVGVLLGLAGDDLDAGALAGEAETALYLTGSYPEQVAYRLGEFWTLRAEAIGVIPLTAFLFLLGVRLMRAGTFAADERGQHIRGLLLRWGLLVGVPLNLLSFVPVEAAGDAGGLLAIATRYFFPPVLALGYIGVFALVSERGGLSGLLDRFAEIGRTALSCYMLQNVVASVVFYGWGFGLAGRLDATGTVVAWFGIAACLMLCAHLWLRRFSTGPFEMLWRRLAELPMQQRRPAPTIPPAP